MGLQIPLYQQPERHYERRATPPQPDRTSKVCLPSNPETKAKCPFLIQAFVNLKLNVSTYININTYIYIYIYIHIYLHTHARAHTHTHTHIYVRSVRIIYLPINIYIYSEFLLRLLIIVTMFIMIVFWLTIDYSLSFGLEVSYIHIIERTFS